MEPREYEKMYQLEGIHWWFVSKRKLVHSFLKKLIKTNNAHILDIGCGTGANLKSFSRYGKAYGMDVSSLAIKFSSSRGCPYLVQANINNLPFKNNIFDAVTLLDILYHRMVSEDKEALASVYRIIKKGGGIVITDSALEFLRSPHDKAVHGERRYSKQGLKKIVQDAGFNIERLSYTNFLMFPFIYISRFFKGFFPCKVVSSDLKPPNPTINYFLLLVQNFERLLLKYFDLPIGSSILCVARKQALP